MVSVNNIYMHAPFLSKTFLTACQNDDVDTAKNFHDIDRGDLDTIFRYCCFTGKEKIAKWLCSIGIEPTSYEFVYSCYYGQELIAKWLYNLLHPGALEIQSAFQLTCRYGDEGLCKWLYSIGEFELSRCDFEEACHFGNKNVAEWLYSIGNYKLIERDFKEACASGYKDLAEWLRNTGNFEVTKRLFEEACFCGHKNIAEWIYTLLNLNINTLSEQIFHIACQNGRKDIATWLYSLGANPYTLEGDSKKSFEIWCPDVKQKIFKVLANEQALSENDLNILKIIVQYTY